ncbi:MAG: aldo/keto reductase [Candidatus Lokiarchaeota archaeon]|nr:aldo/keto reductase [Candidatus Lokiarchaeota archaeon]
MKFKKLGKTNEKISVLGQGTWIQDTIEKKEEVDYFNKWKQSLLKGIELGMTLIDTAEIYGEGKSEEMVGSVIKESNRDDLFIATKVFSGNLKYDDCIKACIRSLGRLGIKTIDLYQIHWPNATISIEETMRAMEQLVKEGKIRYIGVSNFSEGGLEKAMEVMKTEEIVSHQIEYSPGLRRVERKIYPQCLKEGITLIAYSPLGSDGFQTLKTNKKETLKELAKIYDASIYQVALKWLISKENVVAIPKARTLSHVIDNAKSADLEITEEDLATI